MKNVLSLFETVLCLLGEIWWSNFCGLFKENTFGHIKQQFEKKQANLIKI